MHDAKEVNIPFAQHFKLSHNQSPSDEESIREMSKIPYSSAIGSLMYCMVCSRPNLAHAMSVASKFMANPGQEYWVAIKWIFRYRKGSINMALVYGGACEKDEPNILGFTDADYAANLDRRRLSTGYVFKLWNATIS